MANKNNVIKLLNRIEGTLIADLKSALEWAKSFDDNEASKRGLGGFNFTLFLLALIACETLGFYTKGAIYHLTKHRKEVEVGAYIIDFLQDYFVRDSYFKKMKKILADPLRNHLVHGFASSTANVPFDLGLFIQDGSIQVKSGMVNHKKIIKLNGIAFANQTIRAFLKLKQKAEDGTDRKLVTNILKAKTFSYPVSSSAKNEFDAVFKRTQREGLTFKIRG